MRALLWFNTNIDVIISASDIPDVANPRKVGQIRGMKDVVAGLKHSMKTGIGYEIIAESVPRQLSRLSREVRLGGTSAIMANYLSYKGWKSHIYGPMLSSEIASLFQAKSRVFLWRRKWIRADRFSGGRSKKNYIIEFREGERLGDVVAKGSSRFIVATRPAEYVPDFDLPDGFDFYFLSGFHNLGSDFDISIPERSHMELTTIQNRKVRKKTMDLSYSAWSIGMDFREAREFFGMKTPGDMLSFLEETDHNSVFIHADGFFIGMWRGRAKALRDSLRKAACDAAMYASLRRLMRVDCSRFPEPRSFSGTWKMRDRVIVAVPYRKVADPVRPTGMGDVISASIVHNLLKSGKAARRRQ